eukprot:XP_016660147.1 PREDICTED: uncharacterized protein LOC107883832 isoform X2 [Acyrthosiphon pisum]
MRCDDSFVVLLTCLYYRYTPTVQCLTNSVGFSDLNVPTDEYHCYTTSTHFMSSVSPNFSYSKV